MSSVSWYFFISLFTLFLHLFFGRPRLLLPETSGLSDFAQMWLRSRQFMEVHTTSATIIPLLVEVTYTLPSCLSWLSIQDITIIMPFLVESTSSHYCDAFPATVTYVTIKPVLIHTQGSATFDFNGSGFEVYGNCNAPRAVTLSAVIYSLRCMVGHNVPLNQVGLECSVTVFTVSLVYICADNCLPLFPIITNYYN